MGALVAVALGALTGLGVFLFFGGLIGATVFPRSQRTSRLTPSAIVGESTNGLLWMVAALTVAVVVFFLTGGWWVAALGSAILVIAVPRMISRSGRDARYLARTQAVATWTEMIRDNMAGAAGLEQALGASVALAPKAISAELDQFGRRLQRQPVDEALTRLGEDLNNPAADLVVVALVNATRMEVRELGPLLGRLANSTRAEVSMRQRVMVGRARIRTSARIVVATTVFTIVILMVMSRRLLSVYDSAAGQLWLVLVGAVFGFGAWMLGHYASFEPPPSFVARRKSEMNAP